MHSLKKLGLLDSIFVQTSTLWVWTVGYIIRALPETHCRLLRKTYFCKVQLGLEIWDWSDVRCMCEGQGIQTDAIFSHILHCVCVCVCVVYLPDLSGLEVVCVISHFPSSECPHNQTFIPNILTTSWEPTCCTQALLHVNDVVRFDLKESNNCECICFFQLFLLNVSLKPPSSFHCTLKGSCCVTSCQVPGQAVVSGKHQGWGDVWEVTRPHPETGTLLPTDNNGSNIVQYISIVSWWTHGRLTELQIHFSGTHPVTEEAFIK